MIKNVYFWNNFHNGDVFYSKEFVRDIKNQIGEKHYYIHSNPKNILKDFDIEQINKITPDNLYSVYQDNDDLYINTWLGQSGGKYLKLGFDCSLKTNYLIYSDIFKKLGLEIKPIGYYIPTVDFTKIDTSKIDSFFDNDKKYILLCNNMVHSGQAVNFDFDPIINHISKNFSNITFIISNDTKISNKNVIKASDIIGFNNNLVEISYISTKTEIIIGRASGPFCFSHIKENMSNSNKIFISFSFKENESKWVPDEESQAKQYWFDWYDYSNEYIINSIESILKLKYKNGKN